MSIYQKRWSSVGSGTTPTLTRTTPTATNVLSSGVEPSTVGTSWNSVRWNKPSTSYRASVASRFENNNAASSYTPQRTSRFLTPAAKNAADVASIGPSVSARASRFDSLNMANKEKYRNEARELINKWSSRERNSNFSNSYRSPATRSTFRSSDSLATPTSNNSYSNTAYRTSTSLTPTRPVITPSASRYSAERKSVLSPSPTPVLHTTPKSERPWRQRMADSARIRSTLGDDYRSRQSSAESSVFSPSTRFTTATTSYLPYSSYRKTEESKSPSVAPRAPSIREESKERDGEKQRKKSIRERTARRTSRQNSQQDSSSDEEINRLMRSRSGSQVRRKPRKKSHVETEKLVVEHKNEIMNKSMQSSLYETGQEDSALIQSLSSQITESLTALAVAADSEGFQSCAASPLAPSISRSSSKNGVVKNQIIKSPSLIEVLGLPKSESKSSLNKLYPEDVDDNLQLTHDVDDEEQSDRVDDESQYSAVAHFKPHKIKRLAPVPGLWKSGAENEEFISRNKRFAKEPPRGEAEITMKCPRVEAISKKLKAVEKKKVVLKTKVAPKETAKVVEKAVAPKPTPIAPKEAPKMVEKAVAPKPVDKPAAPTPKAAEKTVAPKPTPIAPKSVDPPKATPIAQPASPKNKEPVVPKQEVAPKVAPKVTPAAPKQEVAPKAAPIAPKAVEKVVDKTVAPKPTPKAAETPKPTPSGAKQEVAPKTAPIAPKAVETSKAAPMTPKAVEPPKVAPITPKAVEVAKEVVAPKAAPIGAKQEAAPMTPKAVETPKVAPIAPKPADPPKQEVAPIASPKVAPIAPKPTPIATKQEPTPLAQPAAPKPGVEKKKVLLKKKKIIPIDDEEPKEPKEPKEQNIELTKTFSKKSWCAQKTEKSIKMRNEHKMSIRCRACATESVEWAESYRRRAHEERATVLVDTPLLDVNHCVLGIRLREKRKKVNKPAPPEPPVLPDREMSRSVSVASRASVILDEMRGTEAAVEWTRDLEDDLIDHYDGILVLPDKSILEQYISRKRGKLDRYKGLRPSSMCSYATSSCASPCPSTVSELCLPSSVLVHEPRRRAMNSAEPADLCPTPVPLNSTPRGFTTKKEAPPVVKPVPFEAPKTLFEKMIQDQANRNRVTANSETRDPSPRRGSEEGMSAISQQFAAAAANNSAHGSVRYAAHIPVRSEQSGRMSTGSVDSQHSGTLDVASKNIDHVIDQARHRHHQHRSKFKEAIDYLDQIFEDLKKECDTDDKNNNDENNKPTPQVPPKSTPSATFVAVKKKPSTTTTTTSSTPSSQHTSTKASASDSTKKSAISVKPATAVRRKSTEASSVKPKPQAAPSPVEVVIPVRKVSGAGNEPTVAETIVLAKKTDKMDFTRRWLHDDLQSLAYLPPANIAPNASYYQDFDEHSLGSCSAEVAAFNKEKKKPNNSRKVSDSSDMIRPRPFRPQPVYPMVDGYNGPSAFEQFSHTLPRVNSQDQIPSEMKRSGSQDPYNTLRSMRSEGDGFDSSRPSPSAFQQVSPFNRGGSMRSSLRSLPDHSPIRQRTAPREEVKDPVLSIDQLVAELELNTENTLSTADKRRSFPTTLGRTAPQQKYHVANDYEKPNRYRAEMRHVPTRGRVQNFATQEPAKPAVTKAPLYAQPLRQSQPPPQQPAPRALDEVTSMLNRAVSQFGDRQPHQHPSVYKQLSQQSFGSVHSNNAFETINQEKINPSRVEAMHNMFERGTAATSWKMAQKEHVEERNQKMSPLQEATYATLNSYSPPPPPPTTSMPRNSSQNQINYHEYTPQPPTSQPPQRPPGSANSSQGGYYSSNSSGIGSNYPSQQQPHQYNNARRSLIMDQQSMSSRMPSVENDDDDGFYDNIGIYDDRRFSRGSELESSSFRQLPPVSSSTSSGHKHNRIGSFLRKIGGGSSRPPGSAASLMSLNKISNETIIKPSGGLMKSNSLSTEPWKKQVLEASMPREANNNHKTGLGARLKNSLFGSRKRLD